MEVFTCKTCGYSTNHKQNFIKHTNRKKPCEKPAEVCVFPCRFCGLTYKHGQSRFRHEKTCSAKSSLLKFIINESEKIKHSSKQRTNENKTGSGVVPNTTNSPQSKLEDVPEIISESEIVSESASLKDDTSITDYSNTKKQTRVVSLHNCEMKL